MAYPPSRSWNAELMLGAVENSDRQTHPNRGGVVTSPPLDSVHPVAMSCTIRGKGC
jgi:hypothetical protein